MFTIARFASIKGMVVVFATASTTPILPASEVASACAISIVSPAGGVSVPFPTANITLHGTAGSSMVGSLVWTNELTGATGNAPVASFWRIEGVALGVGTKLITVSGGAATEPVLAAADDGGNSAYSVGWPNSSNGGFGLGPWNLHTTASSSANGGFFMAHGSSNLDIGPRAWGLYANSGHLTQAIRPFASPLQVGQSFSVRMDNNAINAGGEVGVTLENFAGEVLWAFWFNEGSSEFYQITGGVTGIPFSEQGFKVEFILTGSTTYSAVITPLHGGEARTYTNNLAPSADQTIARFRAYNVNAGPDGARNFYINDLEIMTSGSSHEICADSVSVVREAGDLSLYINEYMASNASTLADEDGDYEDWIELYNAGPEPVHLEGFGLSDDPEDLFRWVFPDVRLEVGEYLLVWASGKDRNGGWVNGILREVYPGISGTAVSDLTSHQSFPEHPATRNLVTTYFEAPSNAGDDYGQRMHGYLLAPATGNYRFWIASDDNSALYLSTDESPANVQLIASVPGWTNPREWNKYAEQISATVPLVAGQLYYMVALHKEGRFGDNLSVRWRLPGFVTEEPIPAGRFRVRSQLHTNFKISSAGEPIQLTAPDGSVVDFVPAQSLPTGVSLGRSPGDPETWLFFDSPTPGASNSTTGYADLLNTPVLSAQAGMFSSDFPLEIFSPDAEVTIRYTTDGSVPADGSPIYSGPLIISSRAGEPNNISTIPTNNLHASDYDAWKLPDGEVFKINTIRTRAFRANALPSAVVTRSFLVHPSGKNRYSLPVFSISTDADNFFDPLSGIYVEGSASGGNYSQRGRDWERPAHLEFFETDGSLAFAQEVGVRIHGGTTRNRPRKSLRIYARSGYGSPIIDYSLFPDKPDGRLQRFILRNSGNDWGESLFRDSFMQSLMQETEVDLQSARPAIVFINGEYWGIHIIRDRYDTQYFDDHYGTGDEDKITQMENNSAYVGGNLSGVNHYNDLRSFLNNPGVSNPANLAHVETQMDVANFLDYQIANIYFRNTDWPGNNLLYWRYATDSYQPDAPHGLDGRWRWALQDTDFGFGLNFGYVANAGSSYGANDAAHNTLAFALDPNQSDWPNPSWSTFMLRKLTENAAVRTRFINRFADLLNTFLSGGRVAEAIDSLQLEFAPEMEEHIRRWGRPSSPGSWSNDVQVMRDFAGARPANLRTHLINQFNEPTGIKTLTLNVSEEAAGHIRINTIDIRPGTPGVPSTPYPWSGIYFQGVPVDVTAVPAFGYAFAGWVHDPDAPATITVSSGMSLTATFTEKPAYQLLHYWSFNDAAALLAPSYTMGGASPIVASGTASGTFSTGQGFTGENARFEDEAGVHFRLNNPLGATVTFTLPTTGYEDVVVIYETRRSGQGPGIQSISYAADGANFIPFVNITTFNEPPILHALDFGAIPEANNNPDFAVRITFEQGSGGIEGNNRFDNVTVEGRSLNPDNVPPVVASRLSLQELVEHAGSVQIDLTTVFSDPDGDPLSFTAASSQAKVVTVGVSGNLLSIAPVSRGEATVTIRASDGTNAPVPTVFRVLVYPMAHLLSGGDFTFDQWASDHPEGTFPAHMIFLQGETNDAAIEAPLWHAYHIPLEDYGPADSATIGFPYNNTERTRINGRGDEGISFINTGRGRDLGGSLLALDTRDVNAAEIGWLAGTIAPGSRSYAIRLQYRVGLDGPFVDLLDPFGQPVEYFHSDVAGHTELLGPVPLPPDALGREYVQLLWRYYLGSGASGARSELRLDDIRVSGAAAAQFTVNASAVPEEGGAVTGAGLYEAGTTAELIAAASQYYFFSHWSGDVPGGSETDNPLFLPVEGDKELTAQFAAEVTQNTGTPLWWLASFGLMSPSFEIAAEIDHDGDGWAAWKEYIAGTDPTDASSRVHLIPSGVDDVFEVRFESSVTRVYTLQSSPDLLNWEDVPGEGPRAGLDGEDIFNVSVPSERLFFRIQVQLP